MSVTIVWNDETNAYEADAPLGYRFASGPYCLISAIPMCNRHPTREEKRFAKEDLRKRLEDDDVIDDEDENADD